MRMILFILLLPFYSFAELSTPPKNAEQPYLNWRNLLKNPGFELGKTGWTASSGTFTIQNSNPGDGAYRGLWDASASGQAFYSESFTIIDGYAGQNGIASCMIKANGSATHLLRVYDGTNVVASAPITSTTSNWSRTTLNFVFPSSGVLRMDLYSQTNEPEISIDDCKFGKAEGFNIFQVSQAEMYGSLKYDGTTNCLWNTGDATGGYTEYPADTDCPTPSVTGYASAPSTKVPRIKFTSLPPGQYMVVIQAYFQHENSTTAEIYNKIFDGSTASGFSATGVNSTTSTFSTANTLIGRFNYSTAQANIEFRPYAISTTTADDPVINNANADKSFEIFVFRFPTSAETAFKPDEITWRVDANISGATIDLGTANQTSYITPNNSGLTLTQNDESSPVGISCSSTNDNSVGSTTCSAGNEEIGIVTNIPSAGSYRACFYFSHHLDFPNSPTTANADVTFQLVNTDNGSQTVPSDQKRLGKTRTQSGGDAFTNDNRFTMPHSNCGTFVFDSAGKKTIRLMYEQEISGTPSNNFIWADASSINGQRDIHITVERINQHKGLLLVNSVIAPQYTGVTALCAADYQSTVVGTQAPDREPLGDCFGSITRSGTGTYSQPINAGIYSSAPQCIVTSNNAAANDNCKLNGVPTTTSIPIACYNTTTAAAQDGRPNIYCAGPK
jgi:hypothetical protein